MFRDLRGWSLGWSVALCLLSCKLGVAQEIPQPGREHQVLEQMVGKWKTNMKMPDGSAYAGTAEFTSECNGLWFCSDFKTDIAGLPFRGKGLDGFDPAKQEFVSIWVDSMSAAPLIFRGKYDEQAKKLTLTTEGPGPDGQPAKWKSVAHFADKDKHVFEMFVTPQGGKEELMMTVDYERLK